MIHPPVPALPAANPHPAHTSRTIMPKVCILTTVHHPRDDRIFHKQALSMAEAGFDVVLVARWGEKPDSGPVRARAVNWSGGKVSRLLVGGYRAFRAALGEKAEIHHFHDPELLWVGLLLRLMGRKVIYDVHEDYSRKILSRGLPGWLSWPASRLVRCLEYGCSLAFNHIVATDSHVAALFPKGKTSIVANYPPRRFFRARSRGESGVKGEPFRIAYVGGVSTARGIGKILDALDLIPDDGVEFHVAGNVAEDELRRRLQGHPKTVYHGVLPWEKVGGLLADCDIGMLVLQRLPAFEYYPGENIIKLWEYLGTGLPVVASDFPRLKTLVEGLEAGLTVDPGNPQAIAGAIQRLRVEPETRKRMAENGRRCVLESRTWEAEADKLLGVYQGLGCHPRPAVSRGGGQGASK